MKPTPEQKTEFFTAYVECALWSSTGDDDAPLDDEFSADDLSDEARAAMEKDCTDFMEANAADLQEVVDRYCYTWGSAGHDFWLTRNGHGAGFWDRGLGAVGDRLSDAAHVYGGVDLYVGDDGQIHQI